MYKIGKNEKSCDDEDVAHVDDVKIWCNVMQWLTTCYSEKWQLQVNEVHTKQ
jgi:hypothetical protein